MCGSRLNSTYLIGAALCWGLGTVLTKYALGGIAPATLLPFQLACSVLLLGGSLIVTRSSVRGLRSLRGIAALGVMNPGISYALGLVGLSRIEASLSVVIWATEPVLIVVLAVAILRERPARIALVCLVCAMAGVALIVGEPSGGASLVGLALTCGAVLVCALYSALLRRIDLRDDTLPVVFVQQASALGFACVVLVVSGERSVLQAATTPSQLTAAIAAGALYYGVAFLLYVAGLRRASVARAGIFLTLIPVFGLIFSYLLLGETMAPVQMVGAAVVVGSMAAFATLGRRRASNERAMSGV